MADLSRGQLIVTGALVLATAFVTVGLLLNFVIYTENLATRDANTEARTAAELRVDLVDDVGRSMRYVTENEHGSQSDLEDGLDEELTLLTDRYSNHSSLAGGTLVLQRSTSNFGTRMAQTDDTRALTSNDGDAEWLVAQRIDPWVAVGPGDSEEVPNPRYLEVTFNRSNLFDANRSTRESHLDDEAYRITVEEVDTSLSPVATVQTWHVYVFRNASDGEAMVTVVEPGESHSTDRLDEFADETCEVDATAPRLDLVRGTFAGQECPQLDFYPDADPDSETSPKVDTGSAIVTTIRVANGDQATGEYEILVDEDSPDNHSGDDDGTADDDADSNYDSPGSQPFEHVSLFAAAVDMAHTTDSLTYDIRQVVTTRPAPGDRRGHRPTLDSCTVTDNSDTSDDDAEYEVDWAVSDIDGNLDEVRLSFTDVLEGSQKDTVTVDVSGDSASGVDTVLDGSLDSDGDPYAVRLVATDQAGNRHSASFTDNADGSGSDDPCA